MPHSDEALKKSALKALTKLVIGLLIIIFFCVKIVVYCGNDKHESIISYIILFIMVFIGNKIFNTGSKTVKLIALFQKYLENLPEQSICSINELASKLGLSPELVKTNLQKMIEQKYFIEDLDGAYIDNKEYTLIFPKLVKKVNKGCDNESSHDHENTETNESSREEYKVVHCPNCGGINKIRSEEVQDCEFCGSPIQ